MYIRTSKHPETLNYNSLELKVKTTNFPMSYSTLALVEFASTEFARLCSIDFSYDMSEAELIRYQKENEEWEMRMKEWATTVEEKWESPEEAPQHWAHTPPLSSGSDTEEENEEWCRERERRIKENEKWDDEHSWKHWEGKWDDVNQKWGEAWPIPGYLEERLKELEERMEKKWKQDLLKLEQKIDSRLQS